MPETIGAKPEPCLSACHSRDREFEVYKLPDNLTSLPIYTPSGSRSAIQQTWGIDTSGRRVTSAIEVLAPTAAYRR